MKSLEKDGVWRLRNVTVPGCLVGKDDDLVVTDITIDGDRFSDRGGEDIEMNRAIVLPCFVDMHTHIDKGHI